MNPHIIALILIAVFAFLSVLAHKMDKIGAIAGTGIAYSIFCGAGFEGLWLLLVFFVLGVAASRWKKQQKAADGLAEAADGQRSIGNALGNGGFAALCGLLALALPNYQVLLHGMLATSLAGATADTLSSEIGNILGKRYIDVLTWKHGKRGDNGVISLEGSLAGLAGACLLALNAYWLLPNIYCLLLVVLGGMVGTLADSILGATFERKGYLGNDAVNFISTALAGASFWLLVDIGRFV